MKKIWILIMCIGFYTHASGQSSLHVKETSVTGLLITDGKFADAEWKNATLIPLNLQDSVNLYLKNHKSHILLGIKFPFRMLAYIDMYVDFGKGYIHHFHSSAQIAERILTDTTWTDQSPPTHWGNADGWYANENKTDRLKAQELIQQNPDRDRTKMLLETTYPFEGYEYIFDKTRFSQKQWKIRIEVRTGMPGSSSVIFPEKSVRKNSDQWFILNF